MVTTVNKPRKTYPDNFRRTVPVSEKQQITGARNQLLANLRGARDQKVAEQSTQPAGYTPNVPAKTGNLFQHDDQEYVNRHTELVTALKAKKQQLQDALEKKRQESVYDSKGRKKQAEEIAAGKTPQERKRTPYQEPANPFAGVEREASSRLREISGRVDDIQGGRYDRLSQPFQDLQSAYSQNIAELEATSPYGTSEYLQTLRQGRGGSVASRARALGEATRQIELGIQQQIQQNRIGKAQAAQDWQRHLMDEERAGFNDLIKTGKLSAEYGETQQKQKQKQETSIQEMFEDRLLAGGTISEGYINGIAEASGISEEKVAELAQNGVNQGLSAAIKQAHNLGVPLNTDELPLEDPRAAFAYIQTQTRDFLSRREGRAERKLNLDYLKATKSSTKKEEPGLPEDNYQLFDSWRIRVDERGSTKKISRELVQAATTELNTIMQDYPDLAYDFQEDTNLATKNQLWQALSGTAVAKSRGLLREGELDKDDFTDEEFELQSQVQQWLENYAYATYEQGYYPDSAAAQQVLAQLTPANAENALVEFSERRKEYRQAPEQFAPAPEEESGGFFGR